MHENPNGSCDADGFFVLKASALCLLKKQHKSSQTFPSIFREIKKCSTLKMPPPTCGGWARGGLFGSPGQATGQATPVHALFLVSEVQLAG